MSVILIDPNDSKIECQDVQEAFDYTETHLDKDYDVLSDTKAYFCLIGLKQLRALEEKNRIAQWRAIRMSLSYAADHEKLVQILEKAVQLNQRRYNQLNRRD